MPAKLDRCVKDLIAKGTPEDSAWAICKSQLGEKNEMKHPDFQKIYNQFLMIPDGESRYLEWISKLNLDESKPYGNSFREAWYNRHVDFQLWKSDSQHTYWKIEVGFPVESMNKNVYTKEELRLASRTLKGGYANLNHKFPLPTIEIPAAEAVTHTITLPDGTKTETVMTEAIVKVPNRLMCPICDTEKTINQLITEGGIVNVSLEASCNYVSNDSRCEGMNFDGFAFLTSKILPGIPLTRIQPLESIMIEALHPSITHRRVKNNVKTLKMEAVDDCPEGQKLNPETGECEPVTEQVDTKGMDDKAILPDEAGQCPPGYILSTVMGQCIPDESCPHSQHWDAEIAKCVPDTAALPVSVDVQTGKSPAPQESTSTDVTKHTVNIKKDPVRMTTDTKTDIPKKDTKVPQIPTDQATQTFPQGGGAPMELPTGTPPLQPDLAQATSPTPNAHDCPDGYTWDANASMCMPSDPITERIGRMKAEDRAKWFEKQSLEWQKRYMIVDKALNEVRGVITEQKSTILRLEKRMDSYNLNKVEDSIKAKELQRRIEDLTLDLDSKRRALEKLQQEHATVLEKYDDAMKTNLELSKRNTKSNEEYLEIAQQKELLEAKLGKARNEAKKIVRIKA